VSARIVREWQWDPVPVQFYMCVRLRSEARSVPLRS
jgi:hypothetical protein